MAGVRSQKRGGEILRRDVEVVSIHTFMSLQVMTPKGAEPLIDSSPSLDLRGRINEPIRNVTELMINVQPKDRPVLGPVRPLPVGSIVHIRPYILAVVTFPRREFELLWSMALSGYVKHAHILFTQPHYNHALVTDLCLSNELIE